MTFCKEMSSRGEDPSCIFFGALIQGKVLFRFVHVFDSPQSFVQGRSVYFRTLPGATSTLSACKAEFKF